MGSKALVFNPFCGSTFGFWAPFDICPNDWGSAIYLYFILGNSIIFKAE